MFEIDTGLVTPITDDAAPDDSPRLGFRSAPPVGPAVVWLREIGWRQQVFYAPEPRPPPSRGDTRDGMRRIVAAADRAGAK